MPALETKDLCKVYPGTVRPALSPLSLSQEQGEILALIGESGSGKTTLLRLLAGLERPDGGSINLHGQLLFGKGRDLPPEKRGIGMVFQDYALFPHFTVRKNILFGLKNLDNSARRTRLDEMLMLTGLRGYEGRYPHELSGGEQQRVALARSLAPSPRLLMMDEPFSNLDESLKRRVRREIRDILKAANTTAILVTHDTQDALAVADRIAILRHGELQQLDTPLNLYRQPANAYVAGFFGRTNLLNTTPVEGGYRTVFGVLALEHSPTEENLLISVRPHEIEIAAAGATDAITGKLREVCFKGAFKEWVVDIDEPAGPLSLIVHVRSTEKALAGQHVLLRLPPDGHFAILQGA